MASQGLLRLVPVGPRRKDLSVINFQPCRGELELPVPWDATEQAALASGSGGQRYPLHLNGV